MALRSKPKTSEVREIGWPAALQMYANGNDRLVYHFFPKARWLGEGCTDWNPLADISRPFVSSHSLFSQTLTVHSSGWLTRALTSHLLGRIES